MTANETELLTLLVERKSLGNAKARALLGWDEAIYEAAKQRLLASGLLAQGRGRGGSIQLAISRRKAVELVTGQGGPQATGPMANRQQAEQPKATSQEARGPTAKRPKAAKATNQESIEKQLGKTAYPRPASGNDPGATRPLTQSNTARRGAAAILHTKCGTLLIFCSQND